MKIFKCESEEKYEDSQQLATIQLMVESSIVTVQRLRTVCGQSVYVRKALRHMTTAASTIYNRNFLDGSGICLRA
jgi:hypothetical protein